MYSKTCCYPYFLQAKCLYDEPYWNAELVDFLSYNRGPTFWLKWACYSILKKKLKCVLDINMMFSNFWHQIEPWFVIDFFAQILMISNNFPFYYKYELLGHFPYSNFANGYKFLTRIKKKITNKDFFWLLEKSSEMGTLWSILP